MNGRRGIQRSKVFRKTLLLTLSVDVDDNLGFNGGGPFEFLVVGSWGLGTVGGDGGKDQLVRGEVGDDGHDEFFLLLL
jgi:hypothetical protein